MKPILPLLYLDGYKCGHRQQYPEGTSLVYSNLTARGSRVPGQEDIVFFGLQYFVKEYLIRQFNESFLRSTNGVWIPTLDLIRFR